MMKSILTGAAIALFTVPALAQEQEAFAVEAVTSDTEVVTAKVNGMVCDFCARAVTKVFGKRAEVADVDVDLDTGEIAVTMNAGQSLDDETVKKLVKKSGYALVSIERSGGV